MINRRTFIAQAGTALAATTFASPFDWAQSQPDVKLEIAPLELEIAPSKLIHTVAYNGRVPGPLIRWPEGKPIVIDVLNRTSVPEIVHWHGLEIPSDMDGAAEEGSPINSLAELLVVLCSNLGRHWQRKESAKGEELGLSEDEVAFYDALEVNDSAVKVLGEPTLKTIARELVDTVRRNTTIDWTVRENIRANLRVLVKRILRKYGYPPDKQEKATLTVLEQAEVLSANWAVA